MLKYCPDDPVQEPPKTAINFDENIEYERQNPFNRKYLP